MTLLRVVMVGAQESNATSRRLIPRVRVHYTKGRKNCKWKEPELPRARLLPPHKLLFFLNIFQTVERYRYEDNNTREHELKVRINTKDRQGVCKCCKDTYTNYHA